METPVLDGKLFSMIFLSAANHLNNNQAVVNQLNVFPVPDGDTGTNMSLTASAAAAEIKRHITSSVGEMAQTAAGAALRGARGNSGVILSQILRGMAKELKDYDICGSAELAKAFDGGVKNAYKSVMKPTEGTILTVARESAESAMKAVKKQKQLSIEGLMEIVVDAAHKSLAKTPDKLPVLKQAGVVDSGGSGLCYVYEGMLFALQGNAVEAEKSNDVPAPPKANMVDIDTADIKYGYCTEFIIMKAGAKPDVEKFTADIRKKGDSMMVVDDEDIVKVHIHTNNPGWVIERAMKLGALTKIKIDNMREEHRNVLMGEAATADVASVSEESKKETIAPPTKKYGFVTVCAGGGIASVFRELGVDEVVEGGQTMNPSTEDILQAANKVPAENVIVLPNNKNIILAAKQAKDICQKNLIVIESKTVPQGVSALYAYLENVEPEENEKAMTEAISRVKSASVTYAVRDTVAEDKEIKTGDILGMNEGKIAVVGKDAGDVATELIAMDLAEESSVVTVFYGEDVTDEQAQQLEEKLAKEYTNVDVMLVPGGQPLYYYIISVE